MILGPGQGLGFGASKELAFGLGTWDGVAPTVGVGDFWLADLLFAFSGAVSALWLGTVDLPAKGASPAESFVLASVSPPFTGTVKQGNLATVEKPEKGTSPAESFGAVEIKGGHAGALGGDDLAV